MTTLRIGTRRSKLALAQAEEVARLLAGAGTLSELVPMTTTGDEGATALASSQGLKGLWIDTLLRALESGEVDVAVHSAKDLPAEDDEDVTIAAVPERAEPWDVLILRDERPLGAGMRAGTSSPRRASQLRAAFPGVLVVELRGNVDTRLRKLAAGDVDALVLAAAGLARLGVEQDHARILSLDEMVPAPGQGALALQSRAGDDRTGAALASLDHPPSHRALDAERSLMWRLGGGCALPLGAFAEVEGREVHLVATIAMPDGTRSLRADVRAGSPEDAAGAAAKDLIAEGAEAILAQVLGT